MTGYTLPILEASQKRYHEIRQNFNKMSANNFGKPLVIFNEEIEIGERCKRIYCVDLGESFHFSILFEYFLQKLASIQLRASPVKFARSPCTDPPQVLRE